MTAVNEGFDLLNIKGVDRKVQHLFSGVLQEDDQGRLWSNFYDGNGNIVDQEVLTISKLKLSSCGILHFSSVNPLSARSFYISDSVTNLIFFVQSYASRFTWEYAAFMVTGAKLERNLFIETVRKFPFVKKFYAIYGHSLVGRIRDCKVQHWLNEKDCLFRLHGGEVVANYKGDDFFLAVGEFSLRNHLRQLGTRQTLSAEKPKNKMTDNFYFSI